MERIWLDAIIKVLSESEIPLHYIRIADLIIERNYYKTNGVSPKNAVNTLLAVSVRYDPKSPFLRVGRGIYTMKKLPPKIKKTQKKPIAKKSKSKRK